MAKSAADLTKDNAELVAKNESLEESTAALITENTDLKAQNENLAEAVDELTVQNQTMADALDEAKEAAKDAKKQAKVKLVDPGKKAFKLVGAVSGPEGDLEPGDEISLDAAQADYYRGEGLID